MEASSGRRLLDPLGQGTREKDCSFGRQGLAPLVFTIQCRPTVSIKWYPYKESKLYIRELPRLVQLRRQFSETPGNRSSSNSSSRAHCQAQGNLSVNSTKGPQQAQGNLLRGKIHLKLISEFKGSLKMQCSKTKEE